MVSDFISSMEKIDKSLRKIIKQRGLDKSLEAARICYVANQIANNRFEAVSFKDGILKIKTKNHLAASEIQLNQKNIISEINDALGEDLVKKLAYIIRA